MEEVCHDHPDQDLDLVSLAWADHPRVAFRQERVLSVALVDADFRLEQKMASSVDWYMVRRENDRYLALSAEDLYRHLRESIFRNL